MLSFRRFLHIILIIVGVGGIFLTYNIHENRPASAQSLPGPVPEREYMAQRQVDKGDAPRVWILGDPEDARCGAVYGNVLQLCRDLQLTVAGEGRLDAEAAEDRDVVIFCDDSPGRWADPEELTGFISGGGRVILAAASSEEDFELGNDAILTTVCKSALKFGGELAYAVNCREDGKIALNRDFIDRFSGLFTGYTIQGLTMETDNFSPEMLEIPGAEIRAVRGMLDSRTARLSWEEDCTVFPAVTAGNTMDDGNLFAIYSTLGAYGLVSHIFDVRSLITRENDLAAWDKSKLQIGYFEEEILSRTSWLEPRTLSQTEDDVRSYLNMNYGWKRSGRGIELDCGGAVKGQAFFFHTGGRIVQASGLTYLDLGEGYYLLRMQEDHGTLTLEEGT